MRRVYDHEQRILRDSAVDVVAGALTGGAYTMWKQGKDQAKAQEDAANRQRAAEMEARRIAAEAKPLEESATLGSPFGDEDALESLGLMTKADLSKRKSSGLGGAATTGLGSAANTLGLGTGV